MVNAVVATRMVTFIVASSGCKEVEKEKEEVEEEEEEEEDEEDEEEKEEEEGGEGGTKDEEIDRLR